MSGVKETPIERPLYRRTEVLSLERHGKLGIDPGKGGWGFARRLVTVPATLSEITLAQRAYPVVFAGHENPIPVIVLGFSQAAGNPHVGEDGAWTEGLYVPAFLRRYPFLVVKGPAEGQMALAADLDAPSLSVEGPEKLFADGKPTNSARRAFEFCMRLHEDFEAARELGAALAGAGLLAPQRAQVRVPDGTAMELTNFLMVDEAKLNALDDETYLGWRWKGWLPSIHAHLMSLAAWGELARRTQTARDAA